MQKPTIAIIGAGPAGLASARHFKELGDVTIFDAKKEVGGMWVYTDYNEFNHPNLESDGYYRLYGNIHSSLYKDLMTNIPKNFMCFKDFKHDESTPHIMKAETYLKYLQDYSNHFQLTKLIEFNTVVENVRLVKNLSNKELESHGLNPNAEKTFLITTFIGDKPSVKQHRLFDFVLVCTGHYSKPYIPEFPGQKEYEGKQLHTHHFREVTKELFGDKRVLLIGTSISANDTIHLLFSEKAVREQATPKQLFVTGTTTSLLQGSTDYDALFKSKKMVLKGGKPHSQPIILRFLRLIFTLVSLIDKVKGKRKVPQPQSKPKTTTTPKPGKAKAVLVSILRFIAFITGLRLLGGLKRRLAAAFIRKVTSKNTRGGVKSFGKGKIVHFNDGTSEVIDTVIYATGYLTSLPFLTNNNDKIIEFDEGDPGHYFGPLYKRIFAINQPKLMFVGFSSRNLNSHPTVERQIMIAKQVSQGLVKLPAKEDMLAELNEELRRLVEDWKMKKSTYYSFGPGYTAEQYQKDLIAMNVLEEDESYRIMEPITKNVISIGLSGNFGQLKTFDYGKYVDGVPYNPTASKF